jgi:hypothetical protein
MNLQEILAPIADIITATFDGLLVPISNLFNTGCIVLGFVGLFIWLSMQLKYDKKAKEEGTLA